MSSVSDISKIIMKSGLTKPATRRYPFKKREPFKRTRGKISIDIKHCIFCVLCDKKCPTGAIKVDREGRVWSIDRLKCIQCSYCVEVCPKKCLIMENQYSEAVTSKTIESFKGEPKATEPKKEGT